MAFIYGIPLLARVQLRSGYGRITGTVSKLGTPGIHRVFLIDRPTMRRVRVTHSDVAGSYQFDRVAQATDGYLVMAVDDSASPSNAAISDYITPESMP